MNKQQILGLLLTTYVYNCTAASVTTEDYDKKVKAREICEASQFDYVVENISPGSDLTLVINQARRLSSRTKRAAWQIDGRGPGSDEPWHEIIHQSIATPSSPSANSDSGSGSGSGSDESWHETIHQSIATPSSPHSAAATPTIHYDDDDEDFPTEHQATASGSGEADEYSAKTTPDGITPPKRVLLILPKSDRPYLMTGPIEINDYNLKICSPSEENDGSEKSFADVKPATVKIITNPETDAPPFFSVTGQGLLFMSGITLDATEVRIRSSLIYTANAMVIIDWSDIILTSSKPSQSHKSILGLKGGTSIMWVKISNSQLYNGISEGRLSMIEPSTPGKLATEARFFVSNSSAYSTESGVGFEAGSFKEITTKNFKAYTSASPDFYTRVMKKCPNRPWYLMSKNDGYGNMLNIINDTGCIKADDYALSSNFSAMQKENSSASGRRFEPLTLFIATAMAQLLRTL